MQEQLAMGLAIKAFHIHGADDFTVSAELDASKPETLVAFTTFKEMLLMAYSEGQKSIRSESVVTAAEKALTVLETALSPASHTLWLEQRSEAIDALKKSFRQPCGACGASHLPGKNTLCSV